MTTASTIGPHTETPRDVEERVLKVIALTKRVPRESVSLDCSFESLGIDSLDRLNILFDLESEFDIEINDEDAKRVENIPQMVAGVLLLVEAKNGAVPGPVPARSGSAEPHSSRSVAASSQDVVAAEGASATKPASSGD